MTILDIITRSKNAWVLYGYLLEKSGGGKEVVSIPQRKIADELKMPYQQVRTAIDFLLTNAILTQQVTQGVTQVKGLIMCYKLSSYNLQKIATNATTNATDNANLTQVPKKKAFAPPTQQEVAEYYIQYATKEGEWKDFSPKHFIDYYESTNWHLSNGKKMVSWKQAITGVWVSSGKRKTLTEEKWRMLYNNEKPLIELGVGEYLDYQGNRRYKLSNGNSPQVIVPFSAPKRENMDQLWSNQTNTWYYA